MTVLRTILLTIAAATGSSLAAMQPPQITEIDLPPSPQRGLDMELSEAEAMPLEPELAGDLLDFEEESWSGSPIDLLRPIHHLYTDLRRQLVRYQTTWGALPQVRIPLDGPLLGRNPTDPRLIVLRERLGLPREGGLDDALRTKLATYQRAHGLNSDGIAGADTLRSLNRGAAYYERRILLNLERARRLPSVGAASKYILVDAGSSRLWMYENGRPVDSMKVVVGAPATETPMMAALIRYASVNPYWNVPPELVRSLIAPRVLSEGNGYLNARGYEVLDSWRQDAQVISPDGIDWRAVADGQAEVRVRQLPGAGNSMGDIKFMMPNEHGIYLHDTPNKALFAQDDRWVSNGCVRLEDAQRLARWIFGDMPASQDPSRETRVDLETPVPVYITYLTATPEQEGIAFRSDPYQRDDALLARFDGAGDGMTDMPAAALEAMARTPAAAAAPARSAAPAPRRTAAAPTATSATVRSAVRAPAAPGSNRSGVRGPAPGRSATRTTAASAAARSTAPRAAPSAPRRAAARATATPAPVRTSARRTATPAPNRGAAREPAPGRPAARTTATPARARVAARPAPTRASREAAARPAAARANARTAERPTATPAPRPSTARPSGNPAPRQRASRATTAAAATRTKPLR